MKKTFLILIALITLTGCGNKIKCTYSDQNEIMKQEKIYYIYTNKDTMTKIVTKENFEIYNEEINKNYEYVLTFKFDDFKANNIDYKYTHNDNKYNIETTYDLENINEETLNKYINTKDLNEFKKNLIDEGYNCK